MKRACRGVPSCNVGGANEKQSGYLRNSFNFELKRLAKRMV
jgi:hypothetical protein